MHILLTGGTGLIGSALRAELESQGHSITLLTRSVAKAGGVPAVSSLDAISSSERIDAVVNLAGAPISKRWTAAYKKQLLTSRLDTTKALNELILRLETKPKVLLSASAIGFYGSQGDEAIDESYCPNQAQDQFTHQLCHAWEQEAQRAGESGVSVRIARLGVVLADQGGALRSMLPAFKLGLGGKIGSGQQYFSWIHIQDAVAALSFLLNDEKATDGAYNLTATNPVTNAEFSTALGTAIRRPARLPLPAAMVRLLFGEMGAALLLEGQRVVPRKLQAAGFEFSYPDINSALDSLQL